MFSDVHFEVKTSFSSIFACYAMGGNSGKSAVYAEMTGVRCDRTYKSIV